MSRVNTALKTLKPKLLRTYFILLFIIYFNYLADYANLSAATRPEVQWPDRKLWWQIISQEALRLHICVEAELWLCDKKNFTVRKLLDKAKIGKLLIFCLKEYVAKSSLAKIVLHPSKWNKLTWIWTLSTWPTVKRRARTKCGRTSSFRAVCRWQVFLDVSLRIKKQR